MINNFKDNSMRDSGVIYNSTLEQIKKLYQQDKEKAGELAISAIELVLTGEISSNDMMVDIMLEPLKAVRKKDKEKWDKKAESKQQRKIEDYKLDKIAELHLAGLTQKEIGEKLGITQQKVSYWLNEIRMNYPQLLTRNTENTENTADVNVTVNVNGNVNENGSVVSASPQPNFIATNVTNEQEPRAIGFFNF